MIQAWDAQRYQARHSYVYAHGESLIALVQARAGEKILDLGCGSGQLTAKIAEEGATVLGLDRSEEMIEQARRNFPALAFGVADAATFAVRETFDAVFSNAALHWVKDAEGAARSVARALRPGGRFVLEMGGKGNVRAVIDALGDVMGRVETPWYFPSVGEYASLLERNGFEVSFATLFDRPTEVEGDDGMEDWLNVFAGTMCGSDEVRREVANRLRPRMFHKGVWTLDYRRLRVMARRE